MRSSERHRLRWGLPGVSSQEAGEAKGLSTESDDTMKNLPHEQGRGQEDEAAQREAEAFQDV